jgi:hypothetical protein
VGNAIDAIFHALAPDDLWEIRITGAAAGDTVMDSPVLTTIKVRVYGIFTATITERFRQMGISSDADAALTVREEIDMTSQIEYNDVLYEMVQELKGDRYLTGAVYVYGLRRMESVP